MNKALILGAGALVFIGLFGLAYWLTAPTVQTQTPVTTTPSSEKTTELPAAAPVVQSTVATTSTQETALSIKGVGGESIQTANFMNDSVTTKDPINAGYYYLGYHTNKGVSDPTATSNPPYVITYISETQYFNIVLLQEPVGIVREEMQQYLMAHLGIAQDQMCRLSYMVSVPWSVNQVYSGKNLGFSFCPGATVLPK